MYHLDIHCKGWVSNGWESFHLQYLVMFGICLHFKISTIGYGKLGYSLIVNI